MAELSEAASVRRLHDRFGFGLGGDALAQAQGQGLSRSVDRLLQPTGTDRGVTATPAPKLAVLQRPRGTGGEKPDPQEKKAYRQQNRAQLGEVTQWWLDRMVRAEQPTAERLTWFWHGHFATSAQKVKGANLMLGQNQTLRRLGRGSFTALAQAMIVDPALLVWLDGNDNTSKAPNENLSREFMELFTLGHGHYGEDDVREAARALTGWKIDRATSRAVLRPRLHDTGSKQILGADGDFDAASFVTQVLRQSTSAAFVISRLWARLVSATPPSAAVLGRLTRAYGSKRDVTAVLQAIAAEPAFRDQRSTLVKQPVEWTVGLMRALAVRPGQLEDAQRKRLVVAMRGMGQVPFLPPSVGGWPAGGAWLTTAAALSRVEAARLIVSVAALPAEATRTSRKNRPEYLRRLLGVDRFSARTTDAISAVADRLPMALAVAACSPEYTVSV